MFSFFSVTIASFILTHALYTSKQNPKLLISPFIFPKTFVYNFSSDINVEIFVLFEAVYYFSSRDIP